jgi:drug/metabolite transporter (DMT)-like permease
MPAVFVLIWSTGFVVARLGMPHAPPMHFLALRYALSVLCFGVWVALSGARWPQGRAQWGHLAVTGVLMHAGYLGGVWSAVKAGIGAGTVALIVGLQPVITALWLTRQSRPSAVGAGATGPGAERVSALQWLGLALGLGGLVLVVSEKLGHGEITAFNLGLAVFALLSITTGSLYQKRYLAPCDARTAGAVQLLAALVVTMPLVALETEALRWHPDLVIALAWSVLGLTLGGSSLLYLLLQRGASTRVTSLMYLVPPTTALMAWGLFREPLGGWVLPGLLLTGVGVALALRSR